MIRFLQSNWQLAPHTAPPSPFWALRGGSNACEFKSAPSLSAPASAPPRPTSTPQEALFCTPVPSKHVLTFSLVSVWGARMHRPLPLPPPAAPARPGGAPARPRTRRAAAPPPPKPSGRASTWRTWAPRRCRRRGRRRRRRRIRQPDRQGEACAHAPLFGVFPPPVARPAAAGWPWTCGTWGCGPG